MSMSSKIHVVKCYVEAVYNGVNYGPVRQDNHCDLLILTYDLLASFFDSFNVRLETSRISPFLEYNITINPRQGGRCVHAYV